MSEPITLLINRSDVTPYAQIAIHAREETMLQPHILAAQNVDVKPVLGNVFFTDLVVNRLQQKYVQLLEGGTYTHNGNVVTFQGLKAALACYTYARYVLAKNAVDTPFGMVAKTTENSVQADTKLLLNIASEKRSEASAYLHEVVQYLKANANTYTLFENVKETPSKSIHRLNAATRV